ncbi:helix-turn-helix transcriptional regulator [Carboxylicivirga mesophila]|uniref:Helix-turn-helix transcriptional regulator n=1 Tax=Carboxylicivirga mesophila TaxID=1166478 RepID=A0ABS5KAU1_9BACT|nr:AraC family transcriptional regulator [Carboxylicivirga mesophila]MBS2211972.1 helix-turn-helix transcriptional regulator [Carboxylicivirga mesophila]
MAQGEPLIFKFKEGPFINYMSAYHQHFGGELKPESYHYKGGKTEIAGSSHIIADGIELGVAEIIHSEPFKMIRIPDSNPDLLHMVIIHTGFYTQAYANQLQQLEAESAKGIFFYNGLFPLSAEFPANTPYKSIVLKFEKGALKQLIPEVWPLINTMYNSSEGLAYHIMPPREVSLLVDDILHYHKGGFASKALIKARALEVLAITMKTIEQMDDDELNGLHIDDYNRLMRIKKHLLASLADSINVEAIADEFAISISKLNRDFKALFNMTIYKFYTHAKMDEAYRRLQSGQYSVTEVGYDLGYNSLSKFSEMFKKVKGISPSDVVPL